MALQDWRNTMPDGWTNDKNLNKIRIRYEDSSICSFYLYDKNWRCRKIKNFPFHAGKVQALKFAKQYMRTH